eukprot:scaffold64538_cov39-Attheya_sp.AAC.1
MLYGCEMILLLDDGMVHHEKLNLIQRGIHSLQQVYTVDHRILYHHLQLSEQSYSTGMCGGVSLQHGPSSN